MYDYLVDHAIKNVWCTPDQDNQRIYAPKRLTSNGGIKSSFRVMWRLIDMPDVKSHWHVYQIGQISPVILNLLPDVSEWTSFSEAMNSRKLIVDIYTGNGVQLPRFDTYFMFTSDHNLIVAIKKNRNITWDFDNEQPFIRLYSNAYFASTRADAVADIIYTNGANIVKTGDILNIQNEYQQYTAKAGATYVFVNGIRVDRINLFTVNVGDYCEFVYDSSIKKIVDFKLSDLQVFTSTLDSTLKYFLHHADDNVTTIDYRDDIDVFLVYPTGSNSSKGLWYHKNKNDSMRMVTHRDYSIPTAYIAGYDDKLTTILGVGGYVPQNLIVRLHIRQSGYDRALVYEANRIKELYKLPAPLIPRAMLGLDATVPNWQVANLENSGYTTIMAADCCDITNPLVNTAYGYNAISRLLGNTPQLTKTESGVQVADLPYGIQSNCTVYEYNADGEMLGYYQHTLESRYNCINPTATMIEAISGQGGKVLTDRFSVTDIAVDVTQSFRVYWNFKSTVGIPGDWVDITGTDKYTVINGTVTRTAAIIAGTLMVRTEDKFLAYDLQLPMTNGELRFGITQTRPVNNLPTSISMEVPLGEIDIFLNKKSLIRDLDYVLHFPEIAIINKEYLIDPLNTLQNIHVRMTGYCDATMTVNKPGDVGFIEHGLLSKNNRFDIRDDKVLRIVVGGQVYDRSELVFSEEHTGVSILNPINGKPYSIQDTVVPLKTYTAEPTFTVRARALVIDRAVSQYLTLKIPEPVIGTPSAIVNRYALFSPFICKIIYDLKSGVLNDARYKVNYSDMVASAICTPYVHLLQFDPTQQAQMLDSRYVIVHPHNLYNVINLDLYSYRFLERIIKIYTNNLITLSGFVTLS